MNEPKDETRTAAPEAHQPTAANGAGEDGRVQELQQRLEEAERKAAEHWDRFLRASAELENVRRRVEREAAAAHKYALERILGELIAVNDSLELGLKAVAAESAETRAHLEGLQLTHKQFWATLERHGVSAIDPKGEAFNPELHEAVSVLESTEVAPNHVVTVMQKGYKLHDRVLRPAMVVVAKAPSAA